VEQVLQVQIQQQAQMLQELVEMELPHIQPGVLLPILEKTLVALIIMQAAAALVATYMKLLTDLVIVEVMAAEAITTVQKLAIQVAILVASKVYKVWAEVEAVVHHLAAVVRLVVLDFV
jgi:hypothetical protein